MKGRKISPSLKRQIACRYADGEEMASIAVDLDIHPGSLSRLQSDAGYRAILQKLEDAASQEATSKLKRSINKVLEVLLTLTCLPNENEVTHEAFTRENDAGGKVRVNRRVVHVDPKILLVKCQASETLSPAR